jgi:hypothetical protein
MQRRLSATVSSLRRGLTSARSLHASLRSEACALESFIPVIVEEARSGMHQALHKQVWPIAFIIECLVVCFCRKMRCPLQPLSRMQDNPTPHIHFGGHTLHKYVWPDQPVQCPVTL